MAFSRSTALILLVVLAASIVDGAAPTSKSFRSRVTIYNDPAVTGVLNGEIYYNYGTSAQNQRINYDLGAQEIIDGVAKMKSSYYSAAGTAKCDATTYSSAFKIFFYESGDALMTSGNSPAGVPLSITLDSRTCTGYKKASSSSGVAYVYKDSNGLTCRALLGTGATYDFTTINAVAPVSSDFSVPSAWACPAQVCTKPLDVMLVFDQSGSISSSDFTTMLNFGVNIANKFSFGATATKMGLTLFSGTSYLRTVPIASKSDFIAIVQATTKNGLYTCIGCGISSAQSALASTARSGVQQIMIVLTDGQNTKNQDQYPGILANAKAAGIYIFGVGVGSYNTAFIEEMASDIAGVQTTFYSPDYNSLANIVNQLTTATCLNVAETPCGAGCKGFCASGGRCVCPDSCATSNQCQTGSCSASVNGAGCTYATKNCDFGNKCKDYSCDTSSGCQESTKNCNDGLMCTTDTCDSAVGCKNTNVTCTSDACFTYSCNSGSGLCTVKTPKSCDLCLYNNVVCPTVNCQVGTCNPATGTCSYSPKNCNSNNPCIIDGCDVNTGACTHTTNTCDDSNACTVDTCNSATGCAHTTKDCDDGNLCFNYGCNTATGCTSSAKTCNDNNACTIDTCNSATGCVYTPKNCDSGSPCFVGSCNSGSGQCQNASQPCDLCENPHKDCPVITCQVGSCHPSNGSCLYVPKDCSSSDPCLVGSCNGAGQCVTVAKDCDDNNECTADHCDTAHHGCYHTDVNCDFGDKCLSYSCNTNTGCGSTVVDCDDHDECTIDSCNSAIGCLHTARDCPSDPCTLGQCFSNVIGGCQNQTRSCDHCQFPTTVTCAHVNCKSAQCNPATGSCDYTDISCETNNACALDSCNAVSGQCESIPVDCDDHNACTVDTCDETTGCAHTAVDVADFCNDYNVCTTDTCVPASGCAHTPITCGAQDCMDFTVCDAVAGCLYVNHDCSGTSGTNDCHLATCKNDTCVVSAVDGTLDACGTCNGEVDTEAECLILANKVAVGIGAGAIAGIIIGGVSAAVVVGFGSKKGYDYYQARFGEKASMIADNPLYEEKGSSKVNPLFEQELEESSSV